MIRFTDNGVEVRFLDLNSGREIGSFSYFEDTRNYAANNIRVNDLSNGYFLL